ncbi:MAG TPA: hypothetical protein VMM56_13910, partial [Planctomycetaceae bacterium]|nr:hypothetical protein [Planctomycetaceae bacterium]
SADRINQNRDVRYRLSVVLETHLRDVAVGMVESLYKLVTPGGNLEQSADFKQLLADHHQDLSEADSGIEDSKPPAE